MNSNQPGYYYPFTFTFLVNFSIFYYNSFTTLYYCGTLSFTTCYIEGWESSPAPNRHHYSLLARVSKRALIILFFLCFLQEQQIYFLFLILIHFSFFLILNWYLYSEIVYIVYEIYCKEIDRIWLIIFWTTWHIIIWFWKNFVRKKCYFNIFCCLFFIELKKQARRIFFI